MSVVVSRGLFTPQLRRLFVGQALAQLADGLVQAAFAQLIVFEIRRGSTPGAIAQVLAATLLPYSFLGPIAGVVIDRFDRRKVLARSALARSIVAASGVAAWAMSSSLLGIALVLAQTSIGRFLLAAKSAAVPKALGISGKDTSSTAPSDLGVDDQSQASLLSKANAFSSALGVASVFSGAVVGVALVALATPVAFLVGALCYASASAVFSMLEAMQPEGALRRGAGPFRIALEGIAEELRRASRSDVGVPLGALAWHRTALGATIVTVVLIADSRHNLRLAGYTGALAVAGAATLVGSALAPVLLSRWSFSAVGRLCFVFAAGVVAASAATFAIPGLVAAVSGASLGFQVLKVGVDSVLQMRAPDLVRGRVFSLQDAAYNGSFVLGAALVVPLWPKVEAGALMLASAAVFLAGTAIFSFARQKSPRRAPLAAAVSMISSAAAALAFPSPSLWPLALLCFAPAIYFASAADSYKRAAFLGWLGGFAYFLSTHYWLSHKTLFFQPVIAGIFGLTWVPWSLAAKATLGRRHPLFGIVLVPSAWVLAEYARSWDFLGGPWALVGASQWNVPWGLEASSWGGVWLVGWIVVALNVSWVAWRFRGGPRVRFVAGPLAAPVIGLTVISAAWISYVARDNPDTVETLRVAGVQPGVIDPADERFAAAEAITSGLRTQFDLVVWGESSVGEDPFLNSDYMRRLQSLSERVKAPLLVNVDARTQTGSIYKSALMVTKDGPAARYDKQRLVPFGEYVPLRAVFGWVTKFTDAADEDRGRGSRDVSMEIPNSGLTAAPLICFESAFPDMARAVARKGADVLVIQSANTTFQHSWLPEQHASLAALRAAETGRPVVHATVSGVSSVFDPDGRRIQWVKTDYRGAWKAEVPVFQRKTFYLRWGDWIVALSATMTAVWLLACSTLRFRRLSAAERFSDKTGELPGN